MDMESILVFFVGLRLLKFFAEMMLGYLNKAYYLDKTHQARACEQLKISRTEFEKTLAYSLEKYRFSLISDTLGLVIFLAFLVFGGFGLVESFAEQWFPGRGVGTGLVFFAFLGLLSTLLSLPFDYYFTFVIEERHGFNKQNRRTFFVDKFKMLLISC